MKSAVMSVSPQTAFDFLVNGDQFIIVLNIEIAI